MQIQPSVYRHTKVAYYVSSTYSATLASATPRPGTATDQYFYYLVVFPHRPVESDDPYLFVCAVMIPGSKTLYPVDQGNRRANHPPAIGPLFSLPQQRPVKSLRIIGGRKI
jgi:hypothetical protein